ncbi:MAG: tetratricopeptide repeat protein [Longimicrobiales bacterium]
MDGLKLAAQVVVAAGLAFVWPGPALLDWAATPDPAFPAPLTVEVPVRPTDPVRPAPPSPRTGPRDAGSWFAGVKDRCNTVEARNAVARTPPPAGWEGEAHAAACLALGGYVTEARARIQRLPEPQRWQASGVVFDIGHPAADAGDELAAGPLMELVVEFWPNHYMALYHAGASRHQKGEYDAAVAYLERFLEHYSRNDGWTAGARAMIAERPAT